MWSLGYELLKKKSDALTVRFRKLLKEIMEVRWILDSLIVQTKREVAEMMKEASIAMAEAKWAAGDVA